VGGDLWVLGEAAGARSRAVQGGEWWGRRSGRGTGAGGARRRCRGPAAAKVPQRENIGGFEAVKVDSLGPVLLQ